MTRRALAPGEHGHVFVERTPAGDFAATTRWHDPSSGAVRKVKRTGKTEVAARARLRAAVDPATRSTGLDATSTLAQLIAAHLVVRERRNEVRPQSLVRYRSALRSLGRYGVETLPLHDLTPLRLGEMFDAMSTDIPSLSRTAYAATSLALVWGVSIGLLPTNPLRDVSRPRRRRKRPVAMVDGEVRALRDALRAADALVGPDGTHVAGPPSTVALLVDVLLGTGCRIGEALALRWCDVLDLDGHAPRVRVCGTVVPDPHLHRQDETKTSHDRVLLLPDIAAEALRTVVSRRRPGSTDTAPVFASRTGGLISPANARRAIRTAISGTAAEGWTPHAARRTVATRVAATDGIAAAATQLGHASTAVTEASYAERATTAGDHRAALNYDQL